MSEPTETGAGRPSRIVIANAPVSYGGWLVVEQDIFPQTRERFELASLDQRANREFLARRGR